MARKSWIIAAAFSAALGGSLGLVACPGPEPSRLATGGTTATTPTGGEAAGGAGGTTTTTTSSSGPDCACDALDVLIVIDNSYSILDHYQLLLPLFADVGPTILGVVGRACSYHVGVVPLTPEVNPSPPSCNTLGDLSRVDYQGNLCDLDNGIYITEKDVEHFATSMNCLVTEETRPDGTERALEAVFDVLDGARNAPGGCNDGFYRPDAPLLVVLITDSDDVLSDVDGVDGGLDPPAAWYDKLVQMKGGNRNLVAIVGVLSPSSASDAGCDNAPRLHDFLDACLSTNRGSINICAPDPVAFANAADGIGQAICPSAGR